MSKRPPERFNPSGDNPTDEERRLLRPDTPTRRMSPVEEKTLASKSSRTVKMPTIAGPPAAPPVIAPTPPRKKR